VSYRPSRTVLPCRTLNWLVTRIRETAAFGTATDHHPRPCIWPPGPEYHLASRLTFLVLCVGKVWSSAAVDGAAERHSGTGGRRDLIRRIFSLIRLRIQPDICGSS